VTARARLCAVLLSLALAGACSHSHSDNPPHRAIFSPNGEPLSGGPLGFPSCEAALGGWFDRLDGTRQGAITREAFLADARRQFKAMDLNGDGVVTPEVLLRYRATYAPGLAPQPTAAGENDSEREKAGQPGHEKVPGSPAGRSGTSNGAFSRDVPDPVMSADMSLRLKVTAPDFELHAGKVFDRLDTNQDGRLSRAEALLWCDVITPAASGGGWLGIF
jgi:hypothetical protein